MIYLAFLALSTTPFLTALARSYVGTPEPPPSKATIVVPFWKEEYEHISKCVESLRKQNVVKEYPQFFEIIGIGSDCEEAHRYAHLFDRVYVAPPGKLNARDLGFRVARGDIVVSVDADTYYPPNVLNEMLKPFKNSSVVATTGATFMPLSPFMHPFYRLYYESRVLGRLSAVRKEVYFRVGGFNLTIDQTKWGELFEEEEVRFYNKLSKIGKVVYVDVICFEVGRPTSWIRVASFYR